MSTTRGKVEIRSLVQEIITEVLKDEAFISSIVKSVLEKTNIINLQDKIAAHETEIQYLQHKNQKLEERVENMERLHKINQIRIIGIEEKEGENVRELISNLITSKMKVNLSDGDFTCNRIGKHSNTGKHRPILVRMRNYEVKFDVMRARKQLKGMNMKIAIVEDLTQTKHEIYKLASESIGRRKVWTFNGNIFTKVNDNTIEIRNPKDVQDILSGARTT